MEVKKSGPAWARKYLTDKIFDQKNYIALDFEFNRVTHPSLNLVSCVTLEIKNGVAQAPKRWWLHNDKKQWKSLTKYLSGFSSVLAYAAVAEARCYLTLGLNPLDFSWVDLFLEYRMLTNHNDDLCYGQQLVDGKVKFVVKPKPKWERTEEDRGSGFKPTHSLAEATYKILGEIRDTEHKEAMRQLIISDPTSFTEEERESILDYNVEDVEMLPQLLSGMKGKFKSLVGGNTFLLSSYIEEASWRGRYAAHTARMESYGYPIDFEKTKNFSNKVSAILDNCQRDINSMFPDIRPFKWEKKTQRFRWDQKATKEWISKNHDVSKWVKTDTGGISLSLESFERFYHFKHDYPKGNFGAQMLRFLKLKQSLYGFVPSAGGKSKSFWDSVGPDKKVRPYMNIYGAQSSRSQPASTGFMFLKPAWMRALVMPPPGYFMAGIDYGSQEFFVSGIKSGDENMIDAYLSGDPYLAFIKLAGIVPANATKASHFAEREAGKSSVLGMSYLMTKYGLAIKLTQDTGRTWTEEEAQEQIDLFYEAFPDLKEYQDNLLEEYLDNGFIKLSDGWYMWGDNDNHRSISNVPIQGEGACVMRRAVDLAYEKGIYVPFTLHDALYMIGKVGEEDKISDLRDAMLEAFMWYMPEKYKSVAAKIRLEPFAWSPDYTGRGEEMALKDGWKVPISDLYIDGRAKAEYDRFSPYFLTTEEDQL